MTNEELVKLQDAARQEAEDSERETEEQLVFYGLMALAEIALRLPSRS